MERKEKKNKHLADICDILQVYALKLKQLKSFLNGKIGIVNEKRKMSD